MTALPHLRVDTVARDALATVLASSDTLAVIGFDDASLPTDDARCLCVPLQPVGVAPLEVWRTDGPIQRGIETHDGIAIRWSASDALQFAAMEIVETDGIADATERGYARLRDWLARCGYPHLQRIWNYFDAITDGDGDDERYRQFCVGRVRGLGDVDVTQLPAATAIGRQDGVRVLQIYWLAAKQAGTPLENPRQVSAWQYPRLYGPQSPTFARALLPATANNSPLLLSGTASVLGHASQHGDDVVAQLDEVLQNLQALIDTAREHTSTLPSRFTADGTRLKVYISRANDVAAVLQALQTRLSPSIPRIVLHGTVCRRDLHVEIDGVHG